MSDFDVATDRTARALVSDVRKIGAPCKLHIVAATQERIDELAQAIRQAGYAVIVQGSSVAVEPLLDG